MGFCIRIAVRKLPQKTSRQDRLRWKAWIEISLATEIAKVVPKHTALTVWGYHQPTNLGCWISPTNLGCSAAENLETSHGIVISGNVEKAPVENIPYCALHITFFSKGHQPPQVISKRKHIRKKKNGHHRSLKNSQKGPLKTRSPSSTRISKRKDPEKTIINRNPKKRKSQFQRLCKGIVLTWALATAILSAGQIRRLVDIFWVVVSPRSLGK